MSNQTDLKRLEKWIEDVSVYPPAELYFQAPKSQEKKERRCKEICEALYKFNWEGAQYPNPIGTVREIIREMTVLDKMFEYNPFPPKYENIVKLVAKFIKNADNLVVALESMHSKDGRMMDWYDSWKINQLRVQLLPCRWAADILRLKGQGGKVLTQFIDDVEQAQKEMK